MDVRNFNRAQSDKYVGYSTEITKDTEQTIERISDSVSGSLSELNSSLETLLTSKVEDISMQIQEALTTLNNRVEQIKEGLVEELKQQKSSVISNAISQVKESMNLKYTDLENKQQNQRNDLVSERDIFMQKLESHYNGAVNEYNQKIAEVKEAATSRFSGFEETLVEEINTVTNSIVVALRNQMAKFKEVATQLDSTINQDLTIESEELKEKWSTIIQRLEFLNQETETKLNEQYEEAANSLKTTASAVASGLNSYLQATLQSTQNASNEMVLLSKKGLREGSEFIGGKLNEDLDASMKFVEETERKLADTANTLMSATLKLKNDFRTLDATSKEVEVPVVQTTSIIGLDAVLEHLTRIVKDTKRGVTIMTPKHEYIPVEAIKALPMTAKVTIVSALDEEYNRDWINSISEAEANVEIRKFRETGTGAEMPNFIGVERENEEVLIAAQDEATNEVVGILSKSTYFAKLFSYIIISDYARGRSSQIK
jgi:hypothetical protein